MGRESGKGNAEDAAEAGGRSGGGSWSAYSLESENKRATAWLSQGIETLMQCVADKKGSDKAAPDFDFVIVGSGYGGAVAISQIAGSVWEDRRPVTVCMLERGNEYLPGAFPSRFADLTGHIRFSTDETSKARGRRDGLFDVRIGPDVSAVVANGLGGGSLINAGVMAWPVESVFAESAWPKPIREDKTLRKRAEWLKEQLGAVDAPVEDQKKFAAMQRLGQGLKFVRTQITVANRTGPNAQHVHQEKCIACGDCATGCNHQAKTSLDVTLLVTAQHAGAEIYTGATVLKLAKRDSLWVLDIVHTTAHMRRRQLKPFQLRARNVILCAGTFGSTEILLRSATDDLRFSSLLGRRFSANGDSLAVAYNMASEASAVADEGKCYKQRKVGPTITGMVDLRTGQPATDMVIEDLGIPGPLRRAFEETFTTANAIHALESKDGTRYRKGPSPDDPNAVDPRVIRRCLPVAIIGRDSAEGTLLLVHARPEPCPKPPEGDCEDLEGDGAVTVHWPGLRDDPLPANRHAVLDELLHQNHMLGPDGRLLANPMWRLLPPKVASVLGEVRGGSLTVHPLGGCPMGDDVQRGVVDHAGRVFDGKLESIVGAANQSGDATDDKKNPFHDGLYVLDGAMVPTSLGINPSLAIATLAHRAVNMLRETDWQLRRNEETAQVRESAVPTIYRPIFRTPRPAVRPADTMLEFTEQMRGRLRFQGHADKRFRVELTLWFNEIGASKLAGPNGARALTVDPERSELCIYAGPNWPVVPTSEAEPLLRGRLSGQLNIFRHEPSFACQRMLRGATAWFLNRGLRDVAQWFFNRLAGQQDPASGTAGIMDRLRLVSKLASRAGDRRLLEYELSVVEIRHADSEWSHHRWLHQPIRAYKRVTYDIAGNPWLQLMRARLSVFPSWSPKNSIEDTLEVHLPYFGWIGVPLVHFVGQEDEPTALADLTSVWMYIVRTLLHLHTWSLRKPDAPANRTPQRLPGAIGHIVPEIVELVVDKALDDGTPVLARLTRYRDNDVDKVKRPVLMIHGYSASGTTFAHTAIPCNGLAGFLCAESHRDVWVLDLRSSAGMPTATHGWAFEDMGCADIPLAVDHIVNATGSKKIDIVAHCMGVAMLCMGILGESAARTPDDNPFERERTLLSDRINKLVMSQVGPVGLVLTPGNLLRAYLMRYLKNYIRVEAYRFRPDQPASKGDELLDRVLSTIPYAAHGEFRRENPLWPPGVRTPWVGVRHRMDALYGVTFKLENVSAKVLEHIDDFFGPMNFETVSQVIHFAQNTVITDRIGEGCFVNRVRLKKCLDFPILHIQGTENGLVHIDTSTRLKYAFTDLEKFRRKRFAGFGHQDCMIGVSAEKIFKAINAFLERK
jgi:choline dehydrogenase-like flavoprotein